MAHILDGDGLRAGWSCPCCSRCYGPQVDECRHCPDGETGKGQAGVFGPFTPVPPSKPAIPAIFVPIRDVATATPSRIREVQDALNRAAWLAWDIVEGTFVTLPPGAKILPAHPGPEWIRVIPPMIADPGSTRIMHATDEWADVVPGFQCRVPFCAGEYQLEFRLTPADGA